MTVAGTSPVVRSALPDHTQLPDEDGTFVNNAQEPAQSALLTDSLRPILRQHYPGERFFIGEDVGIYWRLTEPPLDGCKSPDWYLVANVPALLGGRMRRSYVLWQEHVRPLIQLEYASGNGAEERDATPETGKFWVYEQGIQPAYYGIFLPDPHQLEMYQRVSDAFVRMEPNERGHYPIEPLGVEVGVWQGRFRGFDEWWLRWWDAQGQLLPTPEEREEHALRLAETERQQKEQERQQKEQALRELEQLKERLRQLGANPGNG